MFGYQNAERQFNEVENIKNTNKNKNEMVLFTATGHTF